MTNLSITANGVHSHLISDSGHNHGGVTGSMEALGYGTQTLSAAYWSQPSISSYYAKGAHSHSIPTGTTGITIQSGGLHTHRIDGQLDLTGSGQLFPTVSPYQTVHYIIYAD
jgi:hypothetical protein